MRERKGRNGGAQATRAPDRTWARAALVALALVGIATAASAVINPLLGRVVHWNIMAVLMPALFVGFTVLLKKRLV